MDQKIVFILKVYFLVEHFFDEDAETYGFEKLEINNYQMFCYECGEEVDEDDILINEQEDN